MDRFTLVALSTAALCAALYGIWRWPIRPICHTVFRIVAVLLGEPPKNGKPGMPGLLDRLSRIEWHVGNGDPVPLRRHIEKEFDKQNKRITKIETLISTYHARSPDSRTRSTD